MARYVRRNRTLFVPTILVATERVVEDGDIFVAGLTMLGSGSLHVDGAFRLDPIRPEDFARATGDMHFLSVAQDGKPILSIDGLNLPVADFLTNGVSDARLFGGDDRMVGARGPQFIDGMDGDDVIRGKRGAGRRARFALSPDPDPAPPRPTAPPSPPRFAHAAGTAITISGRPSGGRGESVWNPCSEASRANDP